MARIRTIKPEFFKHEGLFDAEVEYGLPLRLCFIGLWTQADREGRFRWRPRQLKADILPYDDGLDFSRVLDALATRGFVVRYAIDGENYGYIPSWSRHQAINNREAKSDIPPPPGTPTFPPDNDASSTRAARVEHASGECTSGKEGKGRERKGSSEPIGSGAFAPPMVEPPGMPAKAPDAEVFRLGREVLGKSAGGVIAKLRKSLKYDDLRTLEVVREAAGKDRPMEWVQGVLRGDTTARTSEREYAEIYRGVL